ncbi:nucleotidyltransferase domain-containing protein [Peterkaempfera griseoplana]|uniref:nucleotidyltransferase domain-containing protein n=1 Tax=Peterkaempfera griseoplana TaxID=66896 RepID=UPI0006E3265A|nr:nucleotidyltransferase family protein [Peterkaempfera griseoplana]
MSHLGPEAALLLALTSQQAAPQDLAASLHAAAGEPSFDWAYFLDQTIRHRVGPLVFWNIRRAKEADSSTPMDSSVWSALKALHFYHSQINQILLDELDRVLAATAEVEFRIVPRKGGHLARTAYRTPGLRMMSDLDLLAERDQAEEITALMSRLGYQQGKNDRGRIVPLSRQERLFWEIYGSDLPQFKIATGKAYYPVITIDVSTSLTLPRGGYSVPTKDLLERASAPREAPSGVLHLDPEDTLIDLCMNLHKNSTVLRFIHLGKHRRLLKYVDVAEHIRSVPEGINWTVFAERVDSYGVAAPAYFGLWHADRLFPSVVPGVVLEELAAACAEPAIFLAEYGRMDLEQPAVWQQPFLERFFSRERNPQLPASRSLV